jgi:hypothetical protein
MLFGMVTDIRPEHLLNISTPIDVTLLGVDIFDIPEQLLKAQPFISVTLLGMVKELNPLQPSKEPWPIVVTLLGIVTFVRPEQFLKALSPIDVTL